MEGMEVVNNEFPQFYIGDIDYFCLNASTGTATLRVGAEA